MIAKAWARSNGAKLAAYLVEPGSGQRGELWQLRGFAADNLKDAFRDILLKDGLIEELGPAVCSGRSIFLYGPPGNGKTMVAKGLGRFLNRFGGEIFVPYAVQAEGPEAVRRHLEHSTRLLVGE